ncbi:MAG TPA: hypothetical protein VLS49_13715, partial [Usitatibacter sp.]|nr:hypothetical protein [Usitatibacter sp.]
VTFRMAGEAPAGAVQVDLTSHRRLQHRFRFAEAREVDIKGKGLMQIYRLVGPLQPAARPAAA